MEAMAAESIVAAVWELEGYLTKVRWPIKVEGGNYSDIDVVGIATDGRVRLAECKVRRSPRAVLVLRDHANFAGWLGPWISCVENITRLWNESPAWLPTTQNTKSVEMWFCANLWFETERAQESVEQDFTRILKEHSPEALKNKVCGRVMSTRDVIFSIIERVRSRIARRIRS